MSIIWTGTDTTTAPLNLPCFRPRQSTHAFIQGARGGGAHEYFQQRREPLDGNGLGTGKTLTTIAITGALYQSGCIRRALIVAPISILGVWQEEFDKYADFAYALTVLKGTSVAKHKALQQMTGDGLQVVVVNYESAWRMETELLQWNADLVVCDEGHKIKAHNIAASKAMHRMGAKARYRLLLTGTIITNKAIDIFSPYKFLNPAIFGNSFYAFRNKYFDMTGYGAYTPVLKRHMEAELTERLHSIAYRTTKADCLDLPEITEIVRHVALEPRAAALYRELVKESYTELGQSEVTATNVLTRLLRLSQLTGGFLRDEGGAEHVVSTVKLDMLEEIIESSMQDGQKLVIIARFIPELEAICRMLDKQGVHYARVSGGIKDRDAQVQAFQHDPDVMAFVGQIATAGLGITLTAASTLVFYSLDYSMSNFEQTKARIHRVGQTQKCTYLYLTCQGTVDEKVLQALRDKADLAKLLVDDYHKGHNPFQAQEVPHGNQDV